LGGFDPIRDTDKKEDEKGFDSIFNIEISASGII